MLAIKKLKENPFSGFVLGFIIGVVISKNVLIAGVIGFFGAIVHMFLITKVRINLGEERTEGFLKSEQDYLKNMIVLIAEVIRAGGKSGQHELSFVESRLRKEFSVQFVPIAMSHIRAELTRPSHLKTHLDRIAQDFENPSKIQLMHFLVSICTLDGVMTKNEQKVLRDISAGIQLSQKSLDSIIVMFRFRSEEQEQQRQRTGPVTNSMLDNAYKTLEVSATASEKEIKRAYKKLAIAHHPDKFAHQGDLAQKNAAEKFKVVAGAYDLICKKRGIL